LVHLLLSSSHTPRAGFRLQQGSNNNLKGKKPKKKKKKKKTRPQRERDLAAPTIDEKWPTKPVVAPPCCISLFFFSLSFLVTGCRWLSRISTSAKFQNGQSDLGLRFHVPLRSTPEVCWCLGHSGARGTQPHCWPCGSPYQPAPHVESSSELPDPRSQAPGIPLDVYPLGAISQSTPATEQTIDTRRLAIPPGLLLRSSVMPGALEG
jgi:hypothetical protein